MTALKAPCDPPEGLSPGGGHPLSGHAAFARLAFATLEGTVFAAAELATQNLPQGRMTALATCHLAPSSPQKAPLCQPGPWADCVWR